MWENMTPRTELLLDFCAWIGPLQLGVVLVFFKYQILWNLHPNYSTHVPRSPNPQIGTLVKFEVCSIWTVIQTYSLIRYSIPSLQHCRLPHANQLVTRNVSINLNWQAGRGYRLYWLTGDQHSTKPRPFHTDARATAPRQNRGNKDVG